MRRLLFTVFMLLHNVSACLTEDETIKVLDIRFRHGDGDKYSDLWMMVDQDDVMNPRMWMALREDNAIEKMRSSLESRINCASDDCKKDMSEMEQCETALLYINAMFPKGNSGSFLKVLEKQIDESPVGFMFYLAICYFSSDTSLLIQRLSSSPFADKILHTTSSSGSKAEVTVRNIVEYFCEKYEKKTRSSWLNRSPDWIDHVDCLMAMLLDETLTDDIAEDFYKNLYAVISNPKDSSAPAFLKDDDHQSGKTHNTHYVVDGPVV